MATSFPQTTFIGLFITHFLSLSLRNILRYTAFFLLGKCCAFMSPGVWISFSCIKSSGHKDSTEYLLLLSISHLPKNYHHLDATPHFPNNFTKLELREGKEQDNRRRERIYVHNHRCKHAATYFLRILNI